jgi:hypothetical protein
MNFEDPRPDLIRRILSDEIPRLSEIDELRGQVSTAVFGAPGWEAPEPPAMSEDQIEVVLDLFQALELIEPAEPAFSWNRGGLLRSIGRHQEAADAFLSAARKLRDGVLAGTIVDEEAEEWIESARAYAGRSLVHAGRRVSAALVWAAISDDDYRADLRELMNETALPSEDDVAWVPHPAWLTDTTPDGVDHDPPSREA